MTTTDIKTRAVSDCLSGEDASFSFRGGDGYTCPSVFVGFTTAFDRASNKFYERALHAEGQKRGQARKGGITD